MDEKLFNELTESVREGGQVLRGERQPSRVFVHTSPRQRRKPSPRFAVCVRTDDPALLIPRKIYEITPLISGCVSLTDEAGEAAIYPADHFVTLKLPREVEETLARVA